MKRPMRMRYFVLKILPALCLLCLIQKDSYAWFHSPGNCKNCPVFEPPQSVEQVSKTYAFLPNMSDADSKIRLFKTSFKNSIPASAGELKVDIPFNLLSASVTNVQARIDRRIAADLRLKNLIEQYLAQQKKTAELLKDLDIPYLDAKAPPKKTDPVPDAKKTVPAEELKKKIEEEILFQAGGRDRAARQDNPDLQLLQAGKKGNSNSVSDLERYESDNLHGDYSKNQRAIGSYNGTYGQDTQLPWIFSFGLKLLRYISNNKFEILSWAAVMAVIGLVGTIVVKR